MSGPDLWWLVEDEPPSFGVLEVLGYDANHAAIVSARASGRVYPHVVTVTGIGGRGGVRFGEPKRVRVVPTVSYRVEEA